MSDARCRLPGSFHLRIVAYRGGLLRGIVGMLALAALAGCASKPQADAASAVPSVYELDSSAYQRVFDVAIAIVTEEGLPTELVDRDGGIIETRPAPLGSVLEPWNWPAGGGGAVESTVNSQRRVVRFEFIPSGFRPRPPDEDRPLLGHRAPGLPYPDGGRGVDLAGYEGPIELRVWVFIERAFTPHLQRSTWTFSQRGFAIDPLDFRPIGDDTTRARSIWTPIDRSPELERRTLDALRARLEPPTGS